MCWYVSVYAYLWPFPTVNGSQNTTPFRALSRSHQFRGFIYLSDKQTSNVKTHSEKVVKSGYDSFITTSLPRLDLPTAICSALILGSGLMKLCRFLREADFGVGI